MSSPPFSPVARIPPSPHIPHSPASRLRPASRIRPAQRQRTESVALLAGLSQRSTLEQAVLLQLVLPHLGKVAVAADAAAAAVAYPAFQSPADRAVLLRFLLDVLFYNPGYARLTYARGAERGGDLSARGGAASARGGEEQQARGAGRSSKRVGRGSKRTRRGSRQAGVYAGRRRVVWGPHSRAPTSVSSFSLGAAWRA